jgi:hypothetical protein
MTTADFTGVWRLDDYANCSTGSLQLSIEFTDGSRLGQYWQRSTDGRRPDVLDAWRIPALAEPGRYRRNYLAVE